MKKILAIIALLISSQAYSQNDGAGNTGLSFLKLGVGAESIAMGEAFSSLTEDATAVVYNPSRLLSGRPNNIILMHNSGAQDMNNDFLAAKFNIGKNLGMGIGIIRSEVSGIEVRQNPGEPEQTFDAENLAVGVSLAYRINPEISVGITGKFLYEKIFIDDASGTGFDIGTNYSKNNLSVSFVVANLGSISELRSVSTKLPTSVRFGGAYKFAGGNKLAFKLGVDGFKVLDGGVMHIHAGGEAGYNDLIFLRAGYQTNYENRGFTTGAGVKYKNFNLDYAFVPYMNNFGSGNTISVGINF